MGSIIIDSSICLNQADIDAAIAAYIAAHPFLKHVFFYNKTYVPIELAVKDASGTVIHSISIPSLQSVIITQGDYPADGIVNMQIPPWPYPIAWTRGILGGVSNSVSVNTNSAFGGPSGADFPLATLETDSVFYHFQEPYTFTADIPSQVAAAVSSHRYISIMNHTAQVQQLLVIDSDDVTVLHTIDIAAGASYLYYADSDGIPAIGNEHYFRLHIGSADVTVINTTETHSAAGDPVTFFGATAGFTTGDICDAIGLNDSSAFYVIIPASNPAP